MLWSFNVPTSWFQALNPFFIIVLAQSVSEFWLRRDRHSSELYKMAVGVLITGAGFLFMLGANLQF